jgi:hypothetical protein
MSMVPFCLYIVSTHAYVCMYCGIVVSLNVAYVFNEQCT